VAVKILRQEEVAQIFGHDGRDVLKVIDAASKLDRPLAEALASNRDPQASAACDRTWRTWMTGQGLSKEAYPERFDGTLLLGMSGSPINRGLAVLYSEVSKRAKELEGDAATLSDGEDVWLTPIWANAFRAMSDAALAFGAPRLVHSEDMPILLRAWTSVYS
jgi:hypothetical protein